MSVSVCAYICVKDSLCHSLGDKDLIQEPS